MIGKLKLKDKIIDFFNKPFFIKVSDILGQLTVILAILVFSPSLMVIGGILLMVRYYKYVSVLVHNKTPKKYYY